MVFGQWVMALTVTIPLIYFDLSHRRNEANRINFSLDFSFASISLVFSSCHLHKTCVDRPNWLELWITPQCENYGLSMRRPMPTRFEDRRLAGIPWSDCTSSIQNTLCLFIILEDIKVLHSRCIATNTKYRGNILLKSEREMNLATK